MNIRDLTKFASNHRSIMVLIALVTTFAAVGLILDPPKGGALGWLGAPLLVLGATLFAWAVWPESDGTGGLEDSLAARFLLAITFRGRLLPFFPAIGAGLIAVDLVYNITLSATPSLLTEDIIVLLAAGCLIGYGLVPQKFARERDFVTVFFVLVCLILVLPLMAARIFYRNFEASVDVYSWVALAPPLSWSLSAIGVQNSVHPVLGSTAPGLTFVPRNMGTAVTIVITTSCSGIYSFGIFAAAFGAFVLTEFKRPTKRVWLLFGVGIAAAYVANVFRMVVIVLVGYYSDTTLTDLQNMLIAHSYAGWLIFLAWIGLFWSILLKTLPIHQSKAALTAEAEPQHRRASICEICDGELLPLIPATRCACGTYYHVSCLARVGLCSICGRKSTVEGTPSY